MAAKTKVPPRKPRGRPPKAEANGEPKKRQGYLPSMEPPRIREIDAAADAYAQARDARMRMGEDEQEKQKILLALMKRHQLTAYEFEGKEVLVEDVEKVKVRKAKAAEE